MVRLFRNKKGKELESWSDLARKYGVQPTPELEQADREMEEIRKQEKAERRDETKKRGKKQKG